MATTPGSPVLQGLKNFWQRPEGTVGKVVLVLGSIAVAYGFVQILPFLIAAATDTLHLGQVATRPCFMGLRSHAKKVARAVAGLPSWEILALPRRGHHRLVGVAEPTSEFFVRALSPELTCFSGQEPSGAFARKISKSEPIQNGPSEPSKEERWCAGGFNEVRSSSVASARRFGLHAGGRMSSTQTEQWGERDGQL